MKIWKNKCISLKVKMRLYEAIVLSALLYSAEVWPLTATLTKKAERCPAHHRWQRSILGISWKDRVTNDAVRVRTGQHSMDDILSERRLHWLGHVIRMDHQHIPRQALHWEVLGFKRGPGRPRANWRSTVNKDLSRMESPGRKQRWQLKTDQNGVKVWPNASTWTRVESRSRSSVY